MVDAARTRTEARADARAARGGAGARTNAVFARACREASIGSARASEVDVER
jgi:hypothetical protein